MWSLIDFVVGFSLQPQAGTGIAELIALEISKQVRILLLFQLTFVKSPIDGILMNCMYVDWYFS